MPHTCITPPSLYTVLDDTLCTRDLSETIHNTVKTGDIHAEYAYTAIMQTSLFKYKYTVDRGYGRRRHRLHADIANHFYCYVYT